jgi:hypothetical protein
MEIAMTMHVRTVELVSGGRLKMSLEDANCLTWSKTDRVFFFGIVDALIAYDEINRRDVNDQARKVFEEFREKLEAASEQQSCLIRSPSPSGENN